MELDSFQSCEFNIVSAFCIIHIIYITTVFILGVMRGDVD